MRRTRSPHSSSAYRSIIHHGTSSSSSQQSTPNPSALLRSFESDTNPARPIRPSPLTTASPIPDMPLDLLERIRSFPLFSSAPEEFLVAVGSHLRPQIHAGHDHILTEGEEARAMYWLVRGVVAVTSRDGEAVYAELKPGAFFGEIGVLMDVPRTATIIARTKCLLVVLMKEDLMAELPRFPEMEKAIRQEALERLAILKKKKRLSEGAEAVLKVGEQQQQQQQQQQQERKKHEGVPGEVVTGDVGVIKGGAVVNTKKRKSPSPGVIEDPAVSGSALGSAYVNVRKTLKELPLFATLPADILHFLGLSAQPKSYPPFTDIVRQGTRGSEIYFIVHGEAEVVKEPEEPLSPTMVKKNGSGPATSYTRPRLRQGQYFGEVASLGLSEERTATVRAITTVECLVIGGEALEELWRRCPPEIRAQVEETARKRFHKARQEAEREDVEMSDVGDENVGPTEGPVIITPVVTQMLAADEETRSPTDPDPYLSVDMENLRARRRSSIAPPPAQTADSSGIVVGGAIKIPPVQPAPPLLSPVSLDEPPFPFKRARLGRDSAKEYSLSKQGLPDNVLVAVFKHLDLLSMLKIRAVCRRWRTLLTTSADLCTHVDLSPYNRRVTDHAIIHILAPFIGARPVEININDCFHITDEGFHCLWKTCGRNVKVWRMRSVWDVSAAQIHNMAEYAKGLEEIDWSSCRKVGDNLLARVVGWVVPSPPPGGGGGSAGNNSNVVISPTKHHHHRGRSPHRSSHPPSGGGAPSLPPPPPPGTVIGCPSLRHLNLSYCKHITDRSMAHLALHASQRLESLTLTRCTSVTDAGFQAWASHRFPKLRKLCLADCTYLTDNSVVALVGAARGLTHLDLSFCCALSDTATEVVALGLPQLRELRMAFCGSAVSDASLGCVALHLNELRGLSVRGCVRVTGNGVENVLEGCTRLEWVDVSQCKNLGRWLMQGGVGKWGYDERWVATGLWPPKEDSSSNSSGSSSSGWSSGSSSESEGIGASCGIGGFQVKTLPCQGRVGGTVISRSGGVNMRPVVPPKGVPSWRRRKPVRFVVEKGPGGLR